VKLLYQAKKVPTDRAISFPIIRESVSELLCQTVDVDQKCRDELQMMEAFPFEVPNEEQTPEERQKIEDEKKVKRQDWYKKGKKKPKTEEEEQKDVEELRTRASTALGSSFGERVEKMESQIEFEKTKWLMDNHLKMDESAYDELLRKQSIIDIDLSGKDILLRLDLDVPLSPYEAPQPEKEKEDNSKSNANLKGFSKNITKLNQESIQLSANVQNQTELQEEAWKKRDILDHSLIKKGMNEVRYVIEHLANRTFIMGNLADKHGKVKPENSMKIIHHVIS